MTAADINVDILNTMFGGTVKSVYLDFTKPTTYSNALKDVNCVFIMRPPHLGNPDDLNPFIDALKTVENFKLVSYLSLIGVEKNPVPPHHKIEKYIVKVGLPYCHIRPSFFMQNISSIHAFEIKHSNRIVVPVKKALTSFIDVEDIGEITAHILSEPELHLNKGYSITGPVALDYWTIADILSKELNREITYANPTPSMYQKYWVDIRGLDKEYSKIMGMLYMMTRLGTAKKVTTVFEEVMNKKPQTFIEFARKNRDYWI